MDSKTIIATAVTAVVTMAATGIVGWLIATSGEGMDAAERARIETIVEEEMVTDSGATYAQELNSISLQLVEIQTSLIHIADAVDNLNR